ncbi:murein transglycosylase A [Bradyrhizobium roseum]|uniref:murein transglycosylase A n=1 Tax=Bradyrhizobium roseum TaxID=3056648 RepID=UPI00387EC902
MAPEARPETRRLAGVACAAFALACSLAPVDALARHSRAHKQPPPPAERHLPYPELELPFQVNGGQYAPVAWSEIAGWSEDDHLAAYKAFRVSCKPIAAQKTPPADPKALGTSLRDPCQVAKGLELSDDPKAKAFFEEHFLPLRISRLGEGEGFVTGYYEPIVDGSRTENEVYKVPVYRRPSNLFVRGTTQASAGLPNKGQVFRKIGRRKLVPYYDRGEIEDGAIAGRGLEICYLKEQADLLFSQIQGSARVSLDDGSTVRINYDAHNGYPYTAVGRILIERNIIPRDQMSMQKIREWMENNPNEADELRRQNKSYVFFREVQLSDKDEAVGAQGVPLTPGRSIAVDKSLHVYGTPFFIEGELPIETAQSKTPFRRLMIAQDTGSAIIGPARADLYFGAGLDAGKIAGRLRHGARFVMLVPRSLDPAARGRKLPVPDDRPSEKIAKLFPQTAAVAKPPEVTDATNAKPAAAPAPAPGPAQTAAIQAPVAQRVPLPEPRPQVEAVSTKPVQRHPRRYRHRR